MIIWSVGLGITNYLVNEKKRKTEDGMIDWLTGTVTKTVVLYIITSFML